MPHFDVALIVWPSDPHAGGPRLLGRVSDPDLVDAVRDRIAAARRYELASLERPVRLVREASKQAEAIPNDGESPTPLHVGSRPIRPKDPLVDDDGSD